MMDFIPVQFNVGTFGKYVNLTANESFVSEMIKTLNLDEQISDDFHDFVESLAQCRASKNVTANSVDEAGEYCVLCYDGVYTILMNYIFAKDLASATIDSVRLFSEGNKVAVGPLFAFSKKLQSVCEANGKVANTRSYVGRNAYAEPVSFNTGRQRGFNVR